MKKGKISDEDLLTAIQSGGRDCDEAMAYLYRMHVDKIVSFVVARNGSREEAKDVFQDSLVNLLIGVRKGKFEVKSTIGTYLYAISKNLWYRRFNRSTMEDSYKQANQKPDIGEETPEILLMGDDQKKMVDGLLGSLKTKCKEVLLLWAQKFSMKEIADELGYQNDQVVRNKKNLCLKELKENVRKFPEARNMVQELIK
ncbi:MAG: sigma-70 family RNA polymerase sigma factor [Bacteroidetes bacterium]|nr:sigma-70 family RNA polymerase sigma factor [Bacteroidota bacterium]MCB0843772.1 sigma-70 family RNA polymerase sigma factor [Bacteroidota bacterium]MCB0852592.1 sigma-70 family RNA polymerase sigma factor [Bacteroidota bacterium]